MDLQRFCVKFLAQLACVVDDAKFIDVFHGWIRRKALPAALVDVADYRHVHNGPGVMLIAHEVNIAMDRTDGRLGLLCQRKAAQAGALSERLVAALDFALSACLLLEQEPRLNGSLKFVVNEFEFTANDRLLAVNDPTGVAVLQEELSATARRLYNNLRMRCGR
jgi:hypothetical protein